MTALRIGTWNINGLTPNKQEVELLLAQHKLDILLISEAHCTGTSLITFPDHLCYVTNHPDGTGHAGSAVIIKKTIKHHQMPHYKTDHIQATTIAVQDKSGNFNITAVYCPPKHKINASMFTEFIATLGHRFIAGGDWNAKNEQWGSRLTTTRGRQLKASVDNNNLMISSSCEPTYWPSDPKKIPDLLDFFIMKGFCKHYIKTESCYDGSSDHTPVILTVSAMLVESTGPDKLYNKNTDWASFQEFIEGKIQLRIPLKNEEDIENATKYITTLIQEACWLNTPATDSRMRHHNYPIEVKRAVLEKRRLRRVWHESRLQIDKTKFEKAAAELKDMLRKWHNDTLESQLESLTASASTNYSLWKFTKNYDRPQVAIPPLKTDDGWARTPQNKADTFALHLANVFCPNETSVPESEEVDDIINQDFQMSSPPAPITVREVWRTINKELKDKKAPGFDLITKEVLVQLPRKAIVFITTLFNSMQRVQYFPRLWKISQILMVHKVGKPANEVTSYRPISLLPVLSKVFEKLLLHRMLPLLQKNNIIPNHQFGFRQHHSTVEQVHRVVDKIRKALEEKEYCSSVFLDIQQAFDKVWHKGLLCKIKNSLPHSYYLLLKSYLTDRLFQVKEADSTSIFQQIDAGVPQGSVLGPVLYTIYTSDLPEEENVTTATFADDTAILASDKKPVLATQKLQTSLNKIANWLQKWRIKASASKSVHVTFTLRQGNCPPAHLGNDTLPHQDSVRYLGLHLDRRLTWRHHIKTKRQELKLRYTRLSWILGRNSKLSTDNKLLIYKSILKPVWMYGIQLWGSACDSNIIIIQRMQNMILRNLSNVPWYITNAEIHHHLGMSTVKEESHNTTETYKGKLERHPNKLATKLTTRSYIKRLKRKDILTI